METKYNMVKQAIKSKILDGTFLPHQKIGSESEWMKQFGVSRHTVRLAIGDLVTQGWLYREQGAGTFCADRSEVEKKNNTANRKHIALITPYISDFIFPSILRGIESCLSDQGYYLSLFSTNDDPEKERRMIEKVIAEKFAGVIIDPAQSTGFNHNISYYLNLEQRNIPYLMINASYDELEPIHFIMDDEKGGYLQAEHLINLGHTQIAGFFKVNHIQGVKRMKGYLKAHRMYRLPVNPQNVITYSDIDEEKRPSEELQKLLSAKSQHPTALVCYDDKLALLLLNTLRESKFTVPEDISLVGYDDSFLAEMSDIKLTTIKHPKSEMGRDAAKTILALINKDEKAGEKPAGDLVSRCYEPELVMRKSTKEAAGNAATKAHE